MNPFTDFQLRTTRRDLLNNSSRAVGAAALASLVGESGVAATGNGRGGLPGLPHFAPKAKRVIYLFTIRKSASCTVRNFLSQFGRGNG